MWLKFYKLPSKLFLFNTKTCFKQNLKSTILLKNYLTISFLIWREGGSRNTKLAMYANSKSSFVNEYRNGYTFLCDVST